MSQVGPGLLKQCFAHGPCMSGGGCGVTFSLHWPCRGLPVRLSQGGAHSPAGGEAVSVWKVVAEDLLHPCRNWVEWLWWNVIVCVVQYMFVDFCLVISQNFLQNDQLATFVMISLKLVMNMLWPHLRYHWKERQKRSLVVRRSPRKVLVTGDCGGHGTPGLF